jgi:hypothetical protein
VRPAAADAVTAGVSESPTATSEPLAPRRVDSDSPPAASRNAGYVDFTGTSAGFGCPFLSGVASGSGMGGRLGSGGGSVVHAPESPSHAGSIAAAVTVGPRGVQFVNEDSAHALGAGGGDVKVPTAQAVAAQRRRRNSVRAGLGAGALVALAVDDNDDVTLMPATRRLSSTHAASPSRLLDDVCGRVGTGTCA